MAEAGIEAETGPVTGTGPAAEIPETEKDQETEIDLGIVTSRPNPRTGQP